MTITTRTTTTTARTTTTISNQLHAQSITQRTNNTEKGNAKRQRQRIVSSISNGSSSSNCLSICLSAPPRLLPTPFCLPNPHFGSNSCLVCNLRLYCHSPKLRGSYAWGLSSGHADPRRKSQPNRFDCTCAAYASVSASAFVSRTGCGGKPQNRLRSKRHAAACVCCCCLGSHRDDKQQQNQQPEPPQQLQPQSQSGRVRDLSATLTQTVAQTEVKLRLLLLFKTLWPPRGRPLK